MPGGDADQYGADGVAGAAAMKSSARKLLDDRCWARDIA